MVRCHSYCPRRSVIVHDIASGAKASGPWSCSSRPSAAGASAREERARAARPVERRASYEAVVNAIVIFMPRP